MKPAEIKVLADENIASKVVTSLRKLGIDVKDVKEERWYGKTDSDLLESAFHESRFVLTHDSDFGTLAINEGKPCFGIFYLRLRNVHPDDVTRVCHRFFSLDVHLYAGTIVVIEANRIRIRPPCTPDGDSS